MPDDFVEVGPFAGLELGVELFTIGGDFEGAAARWDKGERRDPVAEVEYLGRQTDGLRGVVSNHAILDPDFGFHRSLLSLDERSGKRSRVKLEQRGLTPLGVTFPGGPSASRLRATD